MNDLNNINETNENEEKNTASAQPETAQLNADTPAVETASDNRADDADVQNAEESCGPCGCSANTNTNHGSYSSSGQRTVVLGSPDTGSYRQTAYAPHQNENNIYRKQKKGASKGFVAVAVCIAILLSGVAGYFGSMYAIKRNGGVIKSGGTVNINYVNSEKPTGDAIKDLGAAAYVASICADTVVEVTTETVTTSSFFGQYVTQGAGSGVIIDQSGYIVTCAHVISGASKITVKLTNGTSYEAELVGIDSQTDIAVIKIEGDSFRAATVGTSASLVVGQVVVAIGNPLGELGGTVTDGIISALDREVEIDGEKYRLLQTNAAINPGNSGGGLFDTAGNLIGIVNAKSSGTDIEGLGFAIPSDNAMEIARQLISDGYISGRVKLGFSLFEITEQTDYRIIMKYGKYISGYGVYIDSSLSPDFQLGDRIIAIDGLTVSSISEIKSMLLDYNVGDVVKITISRMNSNGRSEILDINLTLTEKTADDN